VLDDGDAPLCGVRLGASYTLANASMEAMQCSALYHAWTRDHPSATDGAGKFRVSVPVAATRCTLQFRLQRNGREILKNEQVVPGATDLEIRM
jgi:hypothetical protein